VWGASDSLGGPERAQGVKDKLVGVLLLVAHTSIAFSRINCHQSHLRTNVLYILYSRRRCGHLAATRLHRDNGHSLHIITIIGIIIILGAG
jgi:hypothetical protein